MVEEEKDQGALATISQAVPVEVMMTIAEKQTTNEAWDAIKEIRVGEDRVRKARVQILKSRFDRLIMEESESINDYSRKLISIVGEIRSLDTEVKESVVVEKLFSSVSNKFFQDSWHYRTMGRYGYNVPVGSYRSTKGL